MTGIAARIRAGAGGAGGVGRGRRAVAGIRVHDGLLHGVGRDLGRLLVGTLIAGLAGGRGGRNHSRRSHGDRRRLDGIPRSALGRLALGLVAATLAALAIALAVAALALVARRLLARGLLCRLGVLAARGLLASLAILLAGRFLLAALALFASAAAAVATATVATVIAAVAVAAAIALLARAALVAAFTAALARSSGGGLRRFGGGLADEQRLQPADDAAAGRQRGCHWRRGRRRFRRCHRLRARFAHRCRARMLHLGHRGRGHIEVGLGQRDRRHLARRTAAVARLRRLFVEFVGAQARHFVVRRVQLLVGHDHDRRLVAGLDLAQCAALLVEQVVGDLHRGLHQHLSGVVLHRVLFGQADDRQRQRLDAAHAAVALAARADDLAGLAQARAQALAAHFQQAEARDAPQLHACAVVLERALQAVLDLALVLVRGHVDEVDHHQAAEVAQAQLAGHFLGRLQVGVEGGLLDVAALGGARRVDVDRGQGLGLVDHQGAAGGQADGALVGVLDLRFDLEAVEQRDVVGVVLELAQVVRHHLFDELARLGVHLRGVDQDLADVGAHVVAQGADDQPRFLVDQERRRLGQRGLGHGLPHRQQVVEVPLQLFGVAADAGGADDHAHVVGDLQRVHGALELGAVLALDPARDAAGGGGVRHQHHVAAGQRDERGQRRPLVAALVLVDLDHHLLALAQQLLDAGLVVVDAGGEVVAGDFLQRQEAVALGAVLDEGRFERGLDPGDAALVDVGLLLFLRGLLDVDVVQVLAIDDGDAQFFCLRRIDQHALHCCVLARSRTRNAGAFRLDVACRRRASAWRRWLLPALHTTADRGSACSMLQSVSGRRPRRHVRGDRPARRAGHVQRRRLGTGRSQDLPSSR